MTESTLVRLAAVFSQVTDPRKARGIRHPFQGMIALVFLGLLARITEMAVLVRWATARRCNATAASMSAKAACLALRLPRSYAAVAVYSVKTGAA